MEELEIELINLYHQLIGQDNGIDRDHWSMPFITGVGENYADSEPKVMIVGKATSAWVLDPPNGEQFDQNDPVQLRNKSREESKKYMNEGGSNTAFWRYILGLGQQMNSNWNQPLQHVVWTNLARIGVQDDKPPFDDDFDIQRNICERLLIAEIDTQDPDLIVILTGPYEVQSVKRVFTNSCWHIDNRYIEGNDYLGYDAYLSFTEQRMVLWTRHPRNRSREFIEN